MLVYNKTLTPQLTEAKVKKAYLVNHVNFLLYQLFYQTFWGY